MFTPPPRSSGKHLRFNYTPRTLIGLLCSLALTLAAPLSRADDQLDLRTTTQAPVYLMRNSNGAAFTAFAEKHPVTGELHIKKRPVTPAEIARLTEMGATLAYLSDPDEAPSKSVNSDSIDSKQGSPRASVPSSFSIVRVGGDNYGGFWTTASRPQGMTTHWSQFSLQSYNYRYSMEHVAHALVLDGARLTNQGQISGNGMIVGKSALPGVGCGPASDPWYYGETESYWQNGNALYQNTCSPATPAERLSDGTTNRFTVHANTSQWVTWWVTRNGLTLWSAPPVNTAAQRPYWDPDQGGVLFTIMGLLNGPDFRLTFTNVSTGWF